MTIASPRPSEGPADGASLRLRRLWAWLSRCDVRGCGERPVHLGWCARHAPPAEPGPDEYWGG